MEVDKPGKDSFELRKAAQTKRLLPGKALGADDRNSEANEMDLRYLASRFDPASLDLI